MVLHAGFLMMLIVLLFVSIVHNYNKYSAIVYSFFLFNRVAYLLCLAVLLSLFMCFRRILGHSVTKVPTQDDVIFASWIVNVL